MNFIIQKLTSRKFWMAVAGVATGVAMALCADANDIQTISGAVLSLVHAVTFIITEGRVDAERVKNAVQGTQDALDALEGGED